MTNVSSARSLDDGTSPQMSTTPRGLLLSLFQQLGLHGVLALAVVPTLVWMYMSELGKPQLVNPKRMTELTVRGRLVDFGRRSKEIFLEGRARFLEKPFRVLCEWGDVVVLHQSYIDEIRNNPHMNFAIPTSDDLHSYIPGFDPFIATDGFARVVRLYLTKALSRAPPPPPSIHSSHGSVLTTGCSSKSHRALVTRGGPGSTRSLW